MDGWKTIAFRFQVQELATGLIDHARTSYELEVLLNHNPDGKPWKPGERIYLSFHANTYNLFDDLPLQKKLL